MDCGDGKEKMTVMTKGSGWMKPGVLSEMDYLRKNMDNVEALKDMLNKKRRFEYELLWELEDLWGAQYEVGKLL